MSEERKLILKMLQENRITIDEAEKLLDALQGKSSSQAAPAGSSGATAEERSGENILKQMGPGFDQIMGSVSNLIGSVTSQLGPTIEKKLESWRQQASAPRTGDEIPEDVSLEHTLPLDPGCEKLVFHNPLGDISVTAGEDSQRIWLRLDKKPDKQHRPAVEALQKIQIKPFVEGKEIRLSLDGVDLLRPEQLKVHVHLKIPAYLHLELSTLNHDVSVTQLSHAQGECCLKSQSGDLRLEQVALKRIQLETLSGTIQAEQISESFKATSRSGDILLKGSVYQAQLQSQSGYLRMESAVSHSLRAESQSSDISLQLLEGAGKIDLQTTSGDIELMGRLQAETSLNSASGDLQGDILVSATAAVSLNTNSGDIDLIVRPDSQCKLDIVSRNGDVEGRLEVQEREADAHSLRGRLGSGEGSLMARTNTGDILIS